VTAQIQIENLHYRPESMPPNGPDILRGISLEIEAGAFVAIIGENGSGKTTLLKHINGLFLPSAGRVLVEGLDTRDPQNHRKLRSLVGMVFQNPADQIVASTVEEDVAFGLENANLPSREIQSRVSAQLSTAGLSEEAQRPPHLLSAGQIQKLALVGVLARQPKVILFDEPTSMLDPVARETFLERICQLHRQGMTIIYVTHHMEEAVFADEVVVLEAGKAILSGSPVEIFSHSAKLHEVGLEIPETITLANHFRSLGWEIPKNTVAPDDLIASLPPNSSKDRKTSVKRPIKIADDEVITLRDVHYTYLAGTPLAKTALHGANLDVTANRIHGIAGTNGSGKSTLLQHVNGILRPAQGTVHVGSFQLEDPDTPLRTVVQKVGLVFQNPETQFFEVFVGDEIAYGPRQFELENLRERVRNAMTLVGLDFDAFKDRRLETLSGGEKRKVALASTLVLNQDILLFDEPTAGMAPRAREDLLALFGRLSEEGKTILIASHRLDELTRVAQDVSIMHSGRVTQSGPRQQVLFDQKMMTEVGLAPPLTVKVSLKLMENGWPIESQDTSTPARLLEAIQEAAQ